METLQIDIKNPKVKGLLYELAKMELIEIREYSGEDGANTNGQRPEPLRFNTVCLFRRKSDSEARCHSTRIDARFVCLGRDLCFVRLFRRV